MNKVLMAAPFEAWQLSPNPQYPFGVRSAHGVNVLGFWSGNGCVFTTKEAAEEIAATWNEDAKNGRPFSSVNEGDA